MKPRTFLTRMAAPATALLLLVGACGSTSDSAESDADATTTQVDASESETAAETSDDTEANTPVLAVGPLPETLSGLSQTMTKYVNVWGVDIVATSSTDDAKILHAANVMAQYLDNDADGSPDNPAVVDALVANKAILLMADTPDEFESVGDDVFAALDGFGGQDLYGSETAPSGGFDASLEEVHHLLLNYGWASVYPDQLTQAKGSDIANAMDIARGGQFDTIPASYPEDAWYTYDDETCDYTCMITEYTYWAHTSLLGGQEGRSGEIGQEWKLETADKVRATDTAATTVLEDPSLGLPTVLPDGNYQG